MSGSVAIFGGGVAGLSAAHELAARGFRVDVYEAGGVFGGKARSVPARAGTGERPPVGPDADLLGPDDLPGEHGFRFFPGFYRHLIATMAEIPGHGGRGSVADDLVSASRIHLSRSDRRDVVLLARFPRDIADLLLGVRSAPELFQLGLTPREIVAFTRRIGAFARTAPADRHRFEGTAWWDYLEADRYGDAYRRHFCHGLTRSMVAMSPKVASTRTFGTIFLQMMLDIADPSRTFDRVLRGPTNEVWIAPWRRQLRARGVGLHAGHRLTGLLVDKGLRGATVETADGPRRVEADAYVVAVPAERAAPLFDADVVRAAPELGAVGRLRTEWMVGIQFFLRRDLPLHDGHTVFADSPWALTAVSQARFWRGGPVRLPPGVGGVLSVDLSDWETPGLLTRRPAGRASDAAELAREVLHQMRVSLDEPALLADENVVGWFLSPNIRFTPEGVVNDEPLLINAVGTWAHRPDATTSLPNLFLASDYVRTTTDIACMEAANEAARRAVNGILAHLGGGPPCELWDLVEPRLPLPLSRLRYSGP